jgi:hypothetical protein
MNRNIIAVSGLPGLSGVAQGAQVAEGVLDEMGGPMGLAGRLVGFGADELDAGVPGWAWFAIGGVVGAVAMYYGRDHVARVVEG